MLSVTQRARLLAVIPTTLADTTIKLLWKDRFGNDDHTFPSMRVSILSQGIRVRPNTWAPIRKNYDGYQGDCIQYLGQHQQASISLSLMVESHTAATDQTTCVELDEMLYELQQEIEIYRLGLYWSTDYMKVVPGSGKVTYLPPFMAKAADEHWIYPAVFDFKIEYEFNVLDETPNIHSVEFEVGVGTDADKEYLDVITNVHSPWYEMGLTLRGWGIPLLCDLILEKHDYVKSVSMDVILIVD